MKFIAVLTLGLFIGSSGLALANQKRKAPPKRTSSYEATESYGGSSSRGGQPMAGCGLGSMVIEDNSKWAQVGAAFLNGTGMQTFGISFGTSNCTEDGVASASKEKDAFVEANYADLRKDMVVGKGEYLTSLASFYGCEGASVNSFGNSLKNNQDKLLSSSSVELSNAIDAVVSAEGLSCQG
jgi:hypothetical protein